MICSSRHVRASSSSSRWRWSPRSSTPNRGTRSGSPGSVTTIAAITAQCAAGADTEVELLNGTLLATTKSNGISGTTGFLGADQTVALRWSRLRGNVQNAHKTLLTMDSDITAQLTPTVIKYTSKFHYEIVQGSAAQFTLALPASQSLTRLEGQQIRADWHMTTETATVRR